MAQVPYQTLFTELAQRGIRYLVAGGFAVNFHQVQRATMDLDLIVHLESSNLVKFVELVTELGFVPRVPVPARELADEAKRAVWLKDKHMKVFSFYHPKNSFEVLDIFIQEPRPFDDLDKNKILIQAFGVQVPVVGVDDLIEMKKEAGRDKDLFDISQLRKKK